MLVLKHFFLTFGVTELHSWNLYKEGAVMQNTQGTHVQGLHGAYVESPRTSEEERCAPDVLCRTSAQPQIPQDRCGVGCTEYLKVCLQLKYLAKICFY